MELSGKTLRAYTRQHPQVLKTLEQTGVYRVQKSHIEEKSGAISQYYLELYDWYVRHSERLVPRPEGAEYPIWLFLEEENKLPSLPGSVCLELEIPRDLVVLTDVERWGYRSCSSKSAACFGETVISSGPSCLPSASKMTASPSQSAVELEMRI